MRLLAITVTAGLLAATAPAGYADHLVLAAECLDRGDDAGALPHLRAHVAARPGAVMMRAYLAELLFRAGRQADARVEFERVVADAREESAGPVQNHLVHCHTRLMELAGSAGDGAAEQFHRGVGLLLLVRRWDADPARYDPASAERALTQAAVALREAQSDKPADARTALYLADVYDRLGQPGPARAARRAGRAALPDPGLSPAERGRLLADDLP